MEADKDRDGKISFEEFTKMVENTDVSNSMTLGKLRLKVNLPPTPPLDEKRVFKKTFARCEYHGVC